MNHLKPVRFSVRAILAKSYCSKGLNSKKNVSAAASARARARARAAALVLVDFGAKKSTRKNGQNWQGETQKVALPR